MRVVGYCTGCRKIRSVRVQGPWLPGVPSGICSSCEDKETSRGR